MASNNCNICELQKKTSSPEVWCPQCEESLCSTCSQQHRLQRAKRDHSTISYEDFTKLPPFILNIQTICKDHNEKYQYYCRSHDCPLCKKCLLKSHKKCEDTPEIDDVIHNVKSSAVFEDVWRGLKATHQTLLRAIKDREENLDRLKKRKDTISTQVKERIHRLINQLKKLENKTLSELDSVITENIDEIRESNKILQSKERKLDEIIGQEQLIKKHASNFQTFIGIKQMEREVQDSEGTLKKLSEKGAMNKTDIGLEEDKSVETVLEMKSLGDIQVSRKKSDVLIQTDKPNRAQMMVETRFPKQLTLKQQITLDKGAYFGSCTLPNGLLAFADRANDEVKILQSNGSLQSSVSFKGKGGEGEGAYGVTVINENHVAVSNPESKTISIIDIGSSKVIKTLQTESDVRGIAHSEGHLFYNVNHKGIKKINIETGKIDKVCDDQNVDVYSHVETDGNRICYTCFNSDTVTVLDSDYRVIFMFTEDNILSGPKGISMDQHQNIFVSNYTKHNILLISRDGDECKVVGSKDDVLYYPRDLHYNKDKKELLVVDEKDVARIYLVN